MRAQKVKTIRALERGIDVLLALESLRAATLHELYLRTGLSKATLTRILLTLERRGLIWQRVADTKYRPSHSLKARARHIEETDRLVEAASPLLAALTARTGLDSHLAVPRDEWMEMAELIRPKSTVTDTGWRVGRKVNMLKSGLGRAYLAFSSVDERQRALERLRRSAEPANADARNRAWVMRVLDDTRKCGYGVRDPAFGGDYIKTLTEHDDGMSGMAVPVIVDSRVVCCINVLWRKRIATPEHIARRFLKDLNAVADQIAVRLSKHEDAA
ncbi:MAG TPA: helix-turn-helix domain-containing protein [Burkholderiales bacterium]|nr:helix-turn-helix domain-containing protein [Burkholderiales bacterium]